MKNEKKLKERVAQISKELIDDYNDEEKSIDELFWSEQGAIFGAQITNLESFLFKLIFLSQSANSSLREMIPTIMKEGLDFAEKKGKIPEKEQKDIASLKNLLFTPDLSEKTHEQTDFFNEEDLFRLYSLLVLSSYAYLDAFSQELFRTFIADTSSSVLFDILRRFNPRDKIEARLTRLLSFALGAYERDVTLPSHASCMRQELEKFTKIRNKLAHFNPLIEEDYLVSELGTLIPNRKKRLEQQLREVNAEIESNLPEEMVNSKLFLQKLIEPWKRIFIALDNVKTVVLLYAALVDRAIQTSIREDLASDNEEIEEE